MPVIIAHGASDRMVPSRFSEALYKAAPSPKKLLLVDGAGHNNTMIVGEQEYRQALAELFGLPEVAAVQRAASVRTRASRTEPAAARTGRRWCAGRTAVGYDAQLTARAPVHRMISGDNDTNPNPEEENMKRPLLAALAAGAMTLAVGDAMARDDLVLMRNAAQQFAVLPDGVRYPEGITANPATGDIYVGDVRLRAELEQADALREERASSPRSATSAAHRCSGSVSTPRTARSTS